MGHPANPNEATVQRAAAAATQISNLRDELEQQTTRADDLVDRLAETELLLREAQRERGRIIELLDVDENTPGWFDGFAENLPDLIEAGLAANRARAVVAIVVAAALATLLLAGAFATWWGDA